MPLVLLTYFLHRFYIYLMSYLSIYGLSFAKHLLRENFFWCVENPWERCKVHVYIYCYFFLITGPIKAIFTTLDPVFLFCFLATLFLVDNASNYSLQKYGKRRIQGPRDVLGRNSRARTVILRKFHFPCLLSCGPEQA